MIIDRTPLNFNEVQTVLKGLPDSTKKEEVSEFIKKLIKSKNENSKKIKEELDKLDLVKLKAEYIVKIIDLLPQDATDLNKIFVDVSLNEDETNKILQIIKKNS